MTVQTLSVLPEVLPIFPLPGALLLPRGHLPLHIFEPRYRAMTEAALQSDRLIGMVQPRVVQDDLGGSAVDVYDTGCAGKIVTFAETEDGRYLITLRGVSRFDIAEELSVQDGFRRVRPDFAPYERDQHVDGGGGGHFDREQLLELVHSFLAAKELRVDWQALVDASDEALVTALAMSCPFDPPEKQALLEAPDLSTRAELLISIIEIALRDQDSSRLPILQ